MYFFISVVNNMLNFKLECAAQGSFSKPTDFSISAQLQNSLITYLQAEVPKRIAASKSAVIISLYLILFRLLN